MEFYGISCSFKILFVTRFNSQRDGILRLAAGLSRTAHYVSIPNGMEFYFMLAVIYFCVVSFNSQRDGILQMRWLIADFCNDSFNSQRDGILQGKPTGRFEYFGRFNSQRDGILLKLTCSIGSLRWCFNSQRDGILLHSPHQNASIVSGFNSQRDGILLIEKIHQKLFSRFNSQRDGILPSSAKIAELYTPVSIPNGMEFYVERERAKRALHSFQFSTGWNSTKQKYRLFRNTPVSIPNGMEFYPAVGVEKANLSCFNSQRDGILLYSLQSPKRTLSCFNSQRDGILLAFSATFCDSLWFQFPTGWNSTIHTSPQIRAKYQFQFPTGWNSTEKQARAYGQFQRFNSQRDGILRNWGKRSNGIKKFQFPTGWNSTRL